MSKVNQQDCRALLLPNLSLNSKFNASTLWGAGFVAAFFTMHLPLLPFFGGEYQPLLFIFLVLLVLMVTGNIGREVVFPVFGLMFTLFGVSLWHAIQGSLDIISLIRCSIGLLFVIGAPALIAQVPFGAFRLIVWIHFLFAIFGLLYAEGAAAIVNALGLRGSSYYDGWNAFFASEPSYAALNLAAVIAVTKLKVSVEGQSKEGDWLFLMGIFVLLLTNSLTGLVFAILMIWSWIRKATKNVVKSFLIVITGFAVLAILYAEEMANSRMGGVEEAIEAALNTGSLLPFLFIDESGSWRILVNIGGVLSSFFYPLGTGSVELQNVIFDVIPGDLFDYMLRSTVYQRAIYGFNAQVPLGNYAVFGGLLPLTALLFIVWSAIRSVIRYCDKEARFFVVCYLLIGLLWQSALTAPGWWLILGYALIIKKTLPKKLNSQATLMKSG